MLCRSNDFDSFDAKDEIHRLAVLEDEKIGLCILLSVVVVWKAENAAVGFDVLTTYQPSTVWCSRERLPAAAAQLPQGSSEPVAPRICFISRGCSTI
jgi:hypothetical protein